MKTYELIFTVIAGILLALTLANLALWFIFLKKNKNASAVYSLTNLLVDIFLICTATFSMVMADNSFKPFWIMLTAILIIGLPASAGTILTEEGLVTFFLCLKKKLPTRFVKYQYKGKTLELYPNNQRRTYRFNIQNIKTVKLLADWYPKYGYTNPLTDQNDD